MENYEKKYKEALEKARQLCVYPTTKPFISDLQDLFHELKESDDEKVRKHLISLFEKFVTLGVANECETSEIKVDDILAWLEKQCERPINKVEPKFKDGDWIVYKDTVWKVCNISLLNYYELLKINNEVSTRFIKDVDETAHLWTIQDAKNGDVLNSSRVQATIIFKRFSDDGKHILAYCALQKGIFIKQEMLWDRDFEPAPKNWTDELFKRMKEAGYEWDAEKKELKKIEQKPVNKPKFKIGDVIRRKDGDGLEWTVEDLHNDGYYTIVNSDRDDFIYLDDNWELVKQKPAECRQETKPNGGIVCENFNDGDGYFKVNLAYLSKSQVELIETLVASWQNPTNNTAEWNEEDKRIIDNLVSQLGNLYARKLIKEETKDKYVDWLKALRPQNTWKPSDLQIECLSDAIKNYNSQGYTAPILKELLDKLKKLKE